MTTQPPGGPQSNWAGEPTGWRPEQGTGPLEQGSWRSEQGTWRPGQPWATPPDPGPRSGLLAGVALIVALVFVAGLFVGQSGLLGRPLDNAPPTPAAQPTLTPGATTQPTPSGPLPSLPPGAPEDFALFWEAYEIIREQFVGRDELAELALTYGAIAGLVEALGDTGHSIFLTPEQLAREQESLGGTIVGIGVLLGERNGRPVIVSVVSGGPASRAGLRSGDEIVQVDGENVERLAPEELAPRVRGEAGTTVEIRVYRAVTDEFLDFAIVREEIRFPAATWTMVPGTQIALLRFIQFSQGSAAELRFARDQAIAQGAEGLILDLRSNPGGLVHEAVDAASLFLAEGETVYIRELADGERIPVTTNSDISATDLPLVVLIDEGSASSAEIMSGGLKAAGRGPLVGDTTFGTGTVLITFPLSDGSAVRIAIERWLTPEGELIFDRGIEPTIPVELDPRATPVEADDIRDLTPAQLAAIDDAQLLRAIAELHGAGVP